MAKKFIKIIKASNTKYKKIRQHQTGLMPN